VVAVGLTRIPAVFEFPAYISILLDSQWHIRNLVTTKWARPARVVEHISVVWLKSRIIHPTAIHFGVFFPHSPLTIPYSSVFDHRVLAECCQWGCSRDGEDFRI
jgi:hypothetical protein